MAVRLKKYDEAKGARPALLEAIRQALEGASDDVLGRVAGLLGLPLAGGTDGASAYSETPADRREVAKVQAHAEKFSEQFRKHGTEPAAVVAAFRSARKRDPGLTAERFLNPSGR